MKKILIILTLIGGLKLNAQTPHKNKSYFISQLGILDGNQANSFQFQVAGGVAAKDWRLGIGAGLDYYKVRSVPVFADLRKYFGNGRKAFAFINAGFNIPWPLEDQYKVFFTQSGNTKSKFDIGCYTDLGVGYDIGIGKQKAISLSLGYSVKTLSETYDERLDWIWGWPVSGANPTERKMDYTFRRVSVKAGFRLW